MVHMMVSRQISLVIMAGGMAVLARLLAPEDFGLFAAALAIFAVAEVIADFGLHSYLIRARTIERIDIRAAAGLALMLSAAICALLVAALILLPEPIWPPGMQPILAVLVLALLIQPLIMPMDAALGRELRFGLLSIVGVIRLAVETAVTIGLAFAGFGPLALAYGFLAERVTGAAVLFIAMRRYGRFLPSVQGWRQFFGFGLRFVAISSLPKISEAIVVLLFSRLLGLGQLGTYNRAKTIVGLLDRSLLDGIAPVVLPALSRSLDGGVAPSRLYLVKTDYLVALCWPVFAAIALLAEPLVAVLLGPQWEHAVPVVRILALSGLMMPFTSMSMKLFVALDAAPAYLWIQSAHQFAKVLLAGAGAFISLEGACVGIVAALLIKALLVSRSLKAIVKYRSPDLVRIAGRGAGMTAATLLGPVLLPTLVADLSGLALLASGIALSGLGWLAGAALTRHPLLFEILTMLGARRANDAAAP